MGDRPHSGLSIEVNMKKIWAAASFLTGGLVSTRGAAEGASVYLTFDDGPHPVHTLRLLDLLAKHGAKGTFFLLGVSAQQFPDIVRRMLREGHAIGNHSMTHPKMKSLGPRAQWDEIDHADMVLQELDERTRHPFRPPNGRVTLPALMACLWRRQPLILWTCDSLDYTLDHAAVVRRLRAAAPSAGDVILFHDDAACAADALEVLLPEWALNGLRFPALK